MKLTAGKRILMFFHWLMSVLICAALAIYVIRPELAADLYSRVTGRMTPTQAVVAGIALLAVYVALAVGVIILIFRRGRRGDRGFITVDSSDTGQVRIAVSAIEQMVRQSVTHIDGIHEMKIGIMSDEDAIKIDINAVIVGGSHVPTITMNMQRAIRQFVEINCGVAVRTVSISINSVTQGQESKARRGWGRREEAPVTPSPEAVNASRPVETFAPEPEAEPVAAVEPKAPVEPEMPVEAEEADAPVVFDEAEEDAPVAAYEPDEPKASDYEIPEEPRPIKLTLDYDPAPYDEYANETEEASEAPKSEEEAMD